MSCVLQPGQASAFIATYDNINLDLRVRLGDLAKQSNPVVRLNLRDRSDRNRIVGGLTRLSRVVSLSDLGLLLLAAARSSNGPRPAQVLPVEQLL